MTYVDWMRWGILTEDDRSFLSGTLCTHMVQYLPAIFLIHRNWLLLPHRPSFMASLMSHSNVHFQWNCFWWWHFFFELVRSSTVVARSIVLKFTFLCTCTVRSAWVNFNPFSWLSFNQPAIDTNKLYLHIQLLVVPFKPTRFIHQIVS